MPVKKSTTKVIFKRQERDVEKRNRLNTISTNVDQNAV